MAAPPAVAVTVVAVVTRARLAAFFGVLLLVLSYVLWRWLEPTLTLAYEGFLFERREQQWTEEGLDVIYELSIGNLTIVDRRTGEIKPGLARSWQSLEDGKRFVFELREGLTADDGTVIDAPAVVESFKKTLKSQDPATATARFFEDLEGAEEFRRGGDLAGVRALDQGRVEFRLRHSRPEFLNRIAVSRVGFFPAANFVEGRLPRRPPKVGSGAWRIASVDEESGEVVFRAAERSWLPSPAFKKLRLRPLRESELAELRPRRTLVHTMNSIALPKDFKLTAFAGNPMAVFLGINCDRAPWTSEASRARLVSFLSSILSQVPGRGALRLNDFGGERAPEDPPSPVPAPAQRLKLMVPDGWWGAEGSFVSDFQQRLRGALPQLDVEPGEVRLRAKDVAAAEADLFLVRVNRYRPLGVRAIQALFCPDQAVFFDPGGELCGLAGRSLEAPRLEFDAAAGAIWRKRNCMMSVARSANRVFASADLKPKDDQLSGSLVWLTTIGE